MYRFIKLVKIGWWHNELTNSGIKRLSWISAFLLSTIAPKLLGINLPEECKKIDEKSQKVIEGYGIYSGASVVEYRSFIIAENHVGQTWNGAPILGACAGAMATTAAIGAICEKAKSNIPVLSYTVTYAVGNILLTIWGSIVVLFFS